MFKQPYAFTWNRVEQKKAADQSSRTTLLHAYILLQQATMADSLFASKKIAEQYHSSRLEYGRDVVEYVIQQVEKYSEENAEFGLMVDVGCGSGQATKVLAPYFKEVYATDISREQINVARLQNKHRHVRYEVGRAEDIQVEDDSVDLLLCAEAAHWFDLKAFLAEAARVLKAKGVMVLLGYVSPKISAARNQTPNLTVDFFELLPTKIKEGLYDKHVPEVLEIESKYSGIYRTISASSKHQHSLTQVCPHWTINSVKSLFYSLGTYQGYMARVKEQMVSDGTDQDSKLLDPAEITVKNLKTAIGLVDVRDEELELQACFEIFMVVANGFEHA